MPSFTLQFPTDRLFAHALRILDDASERYGRSFDWTFGGGTVLALRHDHRFSKDVDILVPDPQYLGYLSPRLSDAAAEGDPDYEQGAEFIIASAPCAVDSCTVRYLAPLALLMFACTQGERGTLSTPCRPNWKSVYARASRCPSS